MPVQYDVFLFFLASGVKRRHLEMSPDRAGCGRTAGASVLMTAPSTGHRSWMCFKRRPPGSTFHPETHTCLLISSLDSRDSRHIFHGYGSGCEPTRDTGMCFQMFAQTRTAFHPPRSCDHTEGNAALSIERQPNPHDQR